ncbi:hypothetical protein [Hyphomicrobium sp. LHD-15]|uniref:hypothetical protein n=1 Tax=Hyphomicrobium sp. LHD-15 TaxID=3072142 RepID=UPI00280F7C13|nr:hypothetical protein [Hyphomicrobium sp. LHD-15]MDQ8699218.1 hypothetical protein [Hyphomicrobium sp. LHD-15]
MKKIVCAFTALLLSASVAVAGAESEKSTNDAATPGTEAGQPTSDRSPGKNTSVPLSQATKKDGETSDRTPSKHEGQDTPPQQPK